MKKLVTYVAFIFALVVTSVAAATLADSVRFFVPGVPYPTKVHHALILGVIVFTAILVDLGACLTLLFLRDTNTQRNPQE